MMTAKKWNNFILSVLLSVGFTGSQFAPYANDSVKDAVTHHIHHAINSRTDASDDTLTAELRRVTAEEEKLAKEIAHHEEMIQKLEQEKTVAHQELEEEAEEAIAAYCQTMDIDPAGKRIEEIVEEAKQKIEILAKEMEDAGATPAETKNLIQRHWKKLAAVAAVAVLGAGGYAGATGLLGANAQDVLANVGSYAKSAYDATSGYISSAAQWWNRSDLDKTETTKKN